MKKVLLSCLACVTVFVSLNAQDFSGFNTSNYAGVTGVMLQPASIVDSRYKFDINLFSTGINYANNYLLVDRDALLRFNSNNFSDYKTFKSKYLSEAGLAANEKAWFNVNNRTQMPLSFMATLNSRSAIALNIQSRSIVQGRNIPSALAQMAYNEFYNPSQLNQSIDASGTQLHGLNWLDIGLTYGRVIYSSPKHFLKAAITAKYLGGVTSAYLQSNDFRFGINTDSSLNFHTTFTNYSHSENAEFDELFSKRFKTDANSFAIDAGIVYEYRGNIKQLDKISRNDEKSFLADRRDVNKYIVKFGVSVLDVGSFNFNRSAYSNNFAGTVFNWRVRDEQFNSVKEFDEALAQRTVVSSDNPRKYKVYLPSALSLQLDLRFVKGLYLNLMAYQPLKMGKDDGYRFDNYGYYTITPRWEGRHFGVYIPYTFSDHTSVSNYKQNLLGASFRMGPLFIGSSNLGTMLFNNKLRAADVFAGVKIGITYGKPTKASRFFDKLHGKNSSSDLSTGVVIERIPTDTVRIVSDSIKQSSQLVVDYTNGKVYSVPNQTGNIIIINNNNNYYFGTATSPVKDNIQTYSIIKDSTGKKLDSASSKKLQHLDSLQQLQKDSLNRKKAQLDSMIKKLEELRKNMDSSSTKIQVPSPKTDSVAWYSNNTALLKQYINRETSRLLEEKSRLSFSTDSLALQQRVSLISHQPTDSIALKKKLRPNLLVI